MTLRKKNYVALSIKAGTLGSYKKTKKAPKNKSLLEVLIH